MGLISECTITCPYCWERFVILIEPAPGGLDFIQDCEICCHTVHLLVSQDNDGQLLVNPERAN